MTSRFFRWSKKALHISVPVATIFMLDHQFNNDTIVRNTRTLWAGFAIIVDYKLFFRPGQDIEKLHTRVAERILWVCQKNGGLYIKFGQGIASMNHILPSQYNKTFKVLQDQAPSMPYAKVEKIFQEEFGSPPTEIFKTFDLEPIASASIAQVHKATLADGTEVAVKVQKHYIRPQFFWDMLAYKMVTRIFQAIFHLPLTWSIDYIERHLKDECDFLKEAKNSERTYQDILKEKSFSDDIYVPKVYSKFSTSRILTAEWISGIKITDVEQLKKMNYSLSDIMSKVVAFFSYQIFKTGFLHCDPHPGNIMVRQNPNKKGRIQIVLLDHGLYIEESKLFQQQYRTFWKAMFLSDKDTLTSICRAWGIRDANVFASATLMKPYNPDKAIHLSHLNQTRQDVYEMQLHAKEKIRDLLEDTEKIPREIVFVGRNMNLVRANNKELGSPVNRINIMAKWAVKSMESDWRAWTSGDDKTEEGALGWMMRGRMYLLSRLNYWHFRTVLWMLSVSFYLTKMSQSIHRWLLRTEVDGFEELLDKAMPENWALEKGKLDG